MRKVYKESNQTDNKCSNSNIFRKDINEHNYEQIKSTMVNENLELGDIFLFTYSALDA